MSYEQLAESQNKICDELKKPVISGTRASKRLLTFKLGLTRWSLKQTFGDRFDRNLGD